MYNKISATKLTNVWLLSMTTSLETERVYSYGLRSTLGPEVETCCVKICFRITNVRPLAYYRIPNLPPDGPGEFAHAAGFASARQGYGL